MSKPKTYQLPSPDGLTVSEVCGLVREIQYLMYLDEEAGEVDPDKEIRGTDCVSEVLAILADYKLTPVEVKHD